MLRSPKCCVHKSSQALSAGWKETSHRAADRLHGYLRKGSVSPGSSSAVVTSNLNPHWSARESEFVLLVFFVVLVLFFFVFFSWLPLIEQTHFHTRHTHIPDSYTQTSLAVYLRTNTQTPTSKSILNTHITPDVKRFNFRLPGVFPFFFFYATIFSPVSPVSRQLPLMLASNIQG